LQPSELVWTIIMPSTRALVQCDAIVGILISLYAWYVEWNLETNPMYQPSCNGWFGGSCSKVFQSPYAHIASHWGLLPSGHPLDLSLALTGIILYSAYLFAITIPFHFFMREEIFLTVAVAGGIFSCYLLYVIKYILNDFCIVCTSFHVCNFIMLVLAIIEYRSPSVGRRVRKSRKKAQ